MLKDFLIELDNVYSKFDMKMVSIRHNKDGLCESSCKSDDSGVYAYALSKEDKDEYGEFAFRDWSIVHSLIQSFYSKESPDDFKLELKNDEKLYPLSLKFINGPINFLHYVVPYDFIEKQSIMMNMYRGNKFSTGFIDNNQLNCITDKILKDAKKISSLLSGEKFYFQNMDGKLFISYGKDNTSMDSGKVMVGEVPTDYVCPNVLFDINTFYTIYKIFDGKANISIMKDKIVFSGELETIKACFILSGTIAQ